MKKRTPIARNTEVFIVIVPCRQMKKSAQNMRDPTAER